LISRTTFTADKIIQPECTTLAYWIVLKIMAFMYLAESPIPVDLKHDYYLSPLLVPDDILAQFPKIHFMTGERDPLVKLVVLVIGG
jgi:hypothetical protein